MLKTTIFLQLWCNFELVLPTIVRIGMCQNVYVCIEVAICGDAHGIGHSNWAKGRDPSGSWVQYPNPAEYKNSIVAITVLKKTMENK